MYRTNCESFCNMVFFDIPHSTQAPYTIRCLRGIPFAFLHYDFYVPLKTKSSGGVFNCLGSCCCKENETLEDQLKKRLGTKSSRN